MELDETVLNSWESWNIYLSCEAVEWKHLWFPGGLKDQPDWLNQDFITIRRKIHFGRVSMETESQLAQMGDVPDAN